MTNSQTADIAVLKSKMQEANEKVEKLSTKMDKHMERIEELFDNLDTKYAPKWCEQLLKWFLVGAGGILIAQGGSLLTATAKAIHTIT